MPVLSVDRYKVSICVQRNVNYKCPLWKKNWLKSSSSKRWIRSGSELKSKVGRRVRTPLTAFKPWDPVYYKPRHKNRMISGQETGNEKAKL